MFKLRFALFTGLALSLVACGEVVPRAGGDGGVGQDGSSSDGGNGGDAGDNKPPCEAPIAFEDLTECLYEAQCEFFVRCEGIFPTVEECAELLPAVFGEFELQLQVFGFAIDAEVVNYDANAAGVCLDSFRNGACSGDGGGDDECEPVFRGTTAANGSCFIDQECAAIGSDCETASQECDEFQCCEGSCRPPVPLGGNCLDTGRCEPGAHCVFENIAGGPSTATCQSGEQGSPCDGSFNCDDGFFCAEGSRTCNPTRPTDADCVNDDECSGDDRCVSNKCAAVNTAGAACEGECIGALECVDGQCQVLPGPGENCAAFGRCNSFALECFGVAGAQVCSPKRALGESCGVRECLPGLVCESDVPGGQQVNPECIALLPVGSECNGSFMCDGSACVRNTQTGTNLCTAPENCYE